MALPRVNLISGKVSWVPPTQNTDGTPITTGEITGYTVGLRSLTVTGSAAGTYPIQSAPTQADAVTEAISAIKASLAPDDYALVVRTESIYGPSAWTQELQFSGVLPVPLAPSGVSVA